MQMVQAQLLLTQVLKDNSGRQIFSKDKIRRRQIANMQAIIKSILVLCIKFLEMDLIRLPKLKIHKRRKISKKREIIRKELNNHVHIMRGEGRRLQNYTRKHIQFEFYKVMCSLRRV